MSEDQNASETAEASRRCTLTWAEVDAATVGIDRYEKSSFWVIGHRRGTRLAVPKTSTGVGRAYFYGDYERVPRVEGIRTFTPEERKELHRGGIVAEIDFDAERSVALAALVALAQAVRDSPPPPPRGERKPRRPRVPKASGEPATGVVPDPDPLGLDDPEGISAGGPR